MTTDLLHLLDLPAAALLTAAGDELTLLTLTHEHADKVTIERRRMGTSIDLGELLQIVGLHGLAETPQIQVTEVAAPQLPAPTDAPRPKARRSTRNAETAMLPCPDCERLFVSNRALGIHRSLSHKAPAVAPEPEPVLVAQSTATSAIPVPVAKVSEYTCTACGQSLQLHERCRDCQALLGPEHEAGMADKHGLCSVCVKYRATAERIGVAA